MKGCRDCPAPATHLLLVECIGEPGPQSKGDYACDEHVKDHRDVIDAWKLYTCLVCQQQKTEDEGGLNSTGDINNPVMRWICNECLIGMVCP